MSVRKNAIAILDVIQKSFNIICLIIIVYYVFISPIVYGLLAIAVLSFITLGYWIVYMPVFIQYPYYKLYWKKRTLRITSELPPLLAYPMTIFVELSLDSYFKKGGIRGAEKAVLDEVERQKTVMTTTLMALAKSRQGQQ